MGEVAQSEVLAELERILKSPVLSGSDQLKRLLRLVVTRTLDGQPDLLKEYTLGLDVFQRPAHYDPKVDPIVRVQARRLRAKLEEYYAAEGAGDPIVIRIPKGAYVPAFEGREASAPALRPARWRLVGAGIALLLAGLGGTWWISSHRAAQANLRRSVAVLPLEPFAGSAEANRMADAIAEVFTTEMGKSSLRVVSRTTARRYRDTKLSTPEIARQLQAQWIIEGGVVMENERWYLKLRAIDAQTDRKVWADVFPFVPGNLVEVSSRAAAIVAAEIAARIGHPEPPAPARQ